MKLATMKTGGRDGTSVLVSRDMKRMVVATSAVPTVRDAIENWNEAEDRQFEAIELAQRPK